MNKSHDKPVFYIKQVGSGGRTISDTYWASSWVDRFDGFILNSVVYVGISCVGDTFELLRLDGQWDKGFVGELPLGPFVTLARPEGSAHPNW